MALKEIYREEFEAPKPYGRIRKSKFSPIDCGKCGDLTVRVVSKQKYCKPCGYEVKLEQTRESHSKPEVMQKNRERNRLRRLGLGATERKRAETIPQKPSRVAGELNSEMERVAGQLKGPVIAFTVEESQIPVELSPGDEVKKEPHFHIRQGKAELWLSAQDAGETYTYKRVLREVRKLIPAKSKR